MAQGSDTGAKQNNAQGLTPEQDWWVGPNSFLNWLVGPGSLLGGNFNWGDAAGIGQGGQPGQPNSLFGVPEFNPPITEAYATSITDQLGKYWQDGLVTQQQHDIFNNQIANAIKSNNRSELEAILQQMTAAAEQNTLTQKNEQVRQGVYGSTNYLYDQYRPFYQQQLDRFNNLVANPNQMRTDSELGDALAAAEDTVNADILRGRSEISKGLATRGVSSSGKASSLARGLEERGAQARSGLFNTFQDQARTLRDRYQGGLESFDRDILEARTAADAGNFDRANTIVGRGPNYYAPTATGFDQIGLRLGQERANLGLFLDTIFRGAGLVNDSMNQGFQFLSSIAPGGK